MVSLHVVSCYIQQKISFVSLSTGRMLKRATAISLFPSNYQKLENVSKSLTNSYTRKRYLSSKANEPPRVLITGKYTLTIKINFYIFSF